MNPGSYRPISLLSVRWKVFEPLLNARISPLLVNFICSNKFWFRWEHSTTLVKQTNTELVQVVSKLSESTNKKQSFDAVLLEVSKAFGKVWHEGTSLVSLIPYCYCS